MKVVVDTFPPTLLLDPDGRRGSQASVRWEVKDENLDLEIAGRGISGRRGRTCGVACRSNVPEVDRRASNGMRALPRRSRYGRRSRIRRATSPRPTIELPEGTGSLPDLATNEPGDDGPPESLPIADGPQSRDHGRPWFHAGETASQKQLGNNRRRRHAPADQRGRLRSPRRRGSRRTGEF